MGTRIKLTYCGIDAEGRTTTEAKQNAATIIERMVNVDDSPMMLAFGGHVATMWHNVSSNGTRWAYAIHAIDATTPATPVVVTGHRMMQSSYLTREDCERGMRNHLAQNTYDTLGAFSVNCITDTRDARDHASWCTWQDAYKDGKSKGLSSDDARCYAECKRSGMCLCGTCRNTNRFTEMMSA